MKKSWLFAGLTGLLLSIGGCFCTETAKADPSIGMAAPVNVDATLQGAEEKPEWKLDGVVLFYYAVNFANPVSGTVGDNNILLPLNRNCEFQLADVQIEISKAAASPREWGALAKINYGASIEDNSGDEVNVSEAWLSYNMPLGKANDKGMKLLFKAGRVESMLGKENLDPEENAFLDYSFLRLGLPGTGMGLRAEFSALEGRLELGLSVLNDNQPLGLVALPRLGARDTNNAKSLEIMAAYRHNFAGKLNPWIRGQLGLSLGADDLAGTNDSADTTTILDLIVEGGLTLSGKSPRPLTVALEYVMGRVGGTVGDDWSGLSATVTLGVHPRVDLALRFEYDEMKNNVDGFADAGGAPSPCVMSIAFNVTGKLTTDGRLQGILEFRHDASNEIIFQGDSGSGGEDTQDTLTLAARLLF
jgi:hypothetical protein